MPGDSPAPEAPSALRIRSLDSAGVSPTFADTQRNDANFPCRLEDLTKGLSRASPLHPKKKPTPRRGVSRDTELLKVEVISRLGSRDNSAYSSNSTFGSAEGRREGEEKPDALKAGLESPYCCHSD
jgi:hypothetical protein